MIEVVRIIVDALAHAGLGVNAQLPDVPRDAGDAAPPAVAEIVDATRRDRVMADGDKRDDAPGVPQWPKLVVLEDELLEFDGEVGTRSRDGLAAVSVAYLPRDLDADGVAAASGYTRRAVMRAVRALLTNAAAPERTRNGVYVIAAVPRIGMRLRAAGEPLTGARTPLPHAGAVTFTFDVRDTAP